MMKLAGLVVCFLAVAHGLKGSKTRCAKGKVALNGNCLDSCPDNAPIEVTYGSWKTPDCVAPYSCKDGVSRDGSKCVCPDSTCLDCAVASDGMTCIGCDDTRFLVDAQCFKAVECRGSTVYRKGVKKEGLKCLDVCKKAHKQCGRCDMVKSGAETKVTCLGCRKAKFFVDGQCETGCPTGFAEYGVHSDYGRKCRTPHTCSSKKVKDNTEYEGKKCRCPDKNCLECRFDADGPSRSGHVCTRCGNFMYLKNGICEKDCEEEGFAPGPKTKKFGRTCEPKGGTTTPTKMPATDASTNAPTKAPTNAQTNAPTKPSACETNPCKNDGVCASSADGYQCACKDGYKGVNCGVEINECASNPCKNGADCKDGVNTYECICKDGFEGDICETNIDECALNPCKNGADCMDGVNTYECICKDGFEGDICETNIDECALNPCKNGADCMDGVNTYECSCKDGFEGDNCENKNLAYQLKVDIANAMKGAANKINNGLLSQAQADQTSSEASIDQAKQALRDAERSIQTATQGKVSSSDQLKSLNGYYSDIVAVEAKKGECTGLKTTQEDLSAQIGVKSALMTNLGASMKTIGETMNRLSATMKPHTDKMTAIGQKMQGIGEDMSDCMCSFERGVCDCGEVCSPAVPKVCTPATPKVCTGGIPRKCGPRICAPWGPCTQVCTPAIPEVCIPGIPSVCTPAIPKSCSCLNPVYHLCNLGSVDNWCSGWKVGQVTAGVTGACSHHSDKLDDEQDNLDDEQAKLDKININMKKEEDKMAKFEDQMKGPDADVKRLSASLDTIAATMTTCYADYGKQQGDLAAKGARVYTKAEADRQRADLTAAVTAADATIATANSEKTRQQGVLDVFKPREEADEEVIETMEDIVTNGENIIGFGIDTVWDIKEVINSNNGFIVKVSVFFDDESTFTIVSNTDGLASALLKMYFEIPSDSKHLANIFML